MLVVDDEEPLARIIASYLERMGFACDVALDGPAGLAAAARAAPDFVVLDAMLPGLHGFEVCRQLRATGDAYIVLVTALADVDDIIEGLSAGADDYLTKPFSPRELAARLLTLLRRPRGAPPRDDHEGPLAIGDLVVDHAAHEARLAGGPVDLTPTEFAILHLLAGAAGRALTRREILVDMWGASWFGDEHVIDVHVGNLRRKLTAVSPDGRYVETVRGVGYRAAGTRAQTG